MADMREEATRLVREAELQLTGIDVVPFSPQAFAALKVKISEYVQSLIAESVRLSRRGHADVISAAQVEQASEYLVTSSSGRWFRHLGTIGGILLGASLSNFLSMTTVNQYSATGVVVSALLAVVGAFGVALHIGRG